MPKSEFNYFLDYIKPFSSLVENEALTLEIKKFKIQPTPENLSTLAATMNLCPIDLWRRKVDWSIWIRQKVQNDHLALKERYQGGFSSSTSLKSILKQLQRYDLQTWVLNKLQISEDFLKEHRPLSILAISDALRFTSNFLTREECILIGTRNCQSFMDKDFGLQVKHFKNVKSIYENFCETIPLMERNWDYEILKTSSSSVTFLTKNSELMKDFSHGEDYSSNLTSQIRLSFIQNISSLAGMPGVEVTSLAPLGPNGELKFEVNLHEATTLPFSRKKNLSLVESRLDFPTNP